MLACGRGGFARVRHAKMLLHGIMSVVQRRHRMFDVLVGTFVVLVMHSDATISVVLHRARVKTMMRIFLFVFHKSS